MSLNFTYLQIQTLAYHRINLIIGKEERIIIDPYVRYQKLNLLHYVDNIGIYR